MSKYWEIQEGKIEPATFFKLVTKYFPDATTFFVEGSSIAEDVKKCYESHRQIGDFLPARQTLFPKADSYRCKFSQTLMKELALLADHFAEPELLDHLSIYKGDQLLLAWHDAFANIILIPLSVPEDLISSFCKELGLAYQVV